ncbi:hypothetical protein NCC78_24320 [Micromonospora phytophila]|uniref:hypothetical protein n=1 Tax=Micromonospora phytophila TaxID=709888 RepID=UPI0020308152|nr:hypothetical protein [Micromonospora phytophila]MCM0677779.1 hypothetical protein [Micromonospora phytophila]
MSRRRPGWAATFVALLGTTGLALVAAGLTTTPLPPRPGAADAPTGSRPAPSVPPLPRADPVDVQIPAIGVRARIVPVGADAKGELEVPPLDRPTLAGWYRHGVSPG